MLTSKENVIPMMNSRKQIKEVVICFGDDAGRDIESGMQQTYMPSSKLFWKRSLPTGSDGLLQTMSADSCADDSGFSFGLDASQQRNTAARRRGASSHWNRYPFAGRLPIQRRSLRKRRRVAPAHPAMGRNALHQLQLQGKRLYSILSK